VLELLLLQLELLARRGDRHQSPADLSDLVEHLLVRQVEHLVGLLGRVERLVGLGLRDVVGPLEEAHPDLILAVDGQHRYPEATARPEPAPRAQFERRRWTDDGKSGIIGCCFPPSRKGRVDDAVGRE
jgi:hypothetical protein